jgi:hypothetical protein
VTSLQPTRFKTKVRCERLGDGYHSVLAAFHCLYNYCNFENIVADDSWYHWYVAFVSLQCRHDHSIRTYYFRTTNQYCWGRGRSTCPRPLLSKAAAAFRRYAQQMSQFIVGWPIWVLVICSNSVRMYTVFFP